MKPKYLSMLENEKVRRWYENLEAKSILTATVFLRVLGYYCELNRTNPDAILNDARAGRLKDDFTDFVRKMEKKGRACSFISRFRKGVISWLRFNGVKVELNVNIRGEYETTTIMNERVPTKEELSSMIRKSSVHARMAISPMAFSGPSFLATMTEPAD